MADLIIDIFINKYKHQTVTFEKKNVEGKKCKIL